MEKINKCSASFDIILLLPFFIPGFNSHVIDFFIYLHGYVGLSGEFTSFNGTHLIFVSLLSAVSIMWGVVRFLRPTRFNLIADTIVRFCIAGLIGCFVIFLDASSLFTLFVISELSMAIIQLVAIKKVRQHL